MIVQIEEAAASLNHPQKKVVVEMFILRSSSVCTQTLTHGLGRQTQRKTFLLFRSYATDAKLSRTGEMLPGLVCSDIFCVEQELRLRPSVDGCTVFAVPYEMTYAAMQS